RAATHNKGIMNGVSAVVLATGNDTRAVEAGAHSHAVVDGRYSSLSRFEKNAAGDLVGTLEMPMPVALVGGATQVHPAALAALRVCVAVGVQRGHMAVHAKTLVVSVGASAEEADIMVDRLSEEKAFRFDRAESLLAELRTGGAG